MKTFYEILVLLKRLRLLIKLDQDEKSKIKKFSIKEKWIYISDFFEYELPCSIVPSSVRVNKTSFGLDITATIKEELYHGPLYGENKLVDKKSKDGGDREDNQENGISLSFDFYNEKETQLLNRLSAKDLRHLVDIQCHSCQRSLLLDKNKPSYSETEKKGDKKDKNLSKELKNVDLNSVDNLTSKLDYLELISKKSADSQFSFIVDLPSEYWHEMIDCWMCHQEDYASIQNSHRNGVIKSKPRFLMVGRNHLIVDKSDLNDQAVRFEQDTSPEVAKEDRNGDHDHTPHSNDSKIGSVKLNKWKSVSCSNCETEIGEYLSVDEGKENQQDTKDIFALKLFKYELDFKVLKFEENKTLSVDEAEIETLYYAFSQFFVSDLLEMMDAHATFRFIIEAPERNSMLLWIMNSNILIPDPDNSKKPVSAIKLLYAKDDEIASVMMDWKQDKQTEHIHLTTSKHWDLIVKDIIDACPFEQKDNTFLIPNYSFDSNDHAKFEVGYFTSKDFRV